MRAQLAAKYKEAGKPVASEAVTIAPLDVTAHSLLVADLDREYLLFRTDNPRKLSTQTVAFRVPMVAGVDRLHERLSTTPQAVQLVLLGGYKVNTIAGLTVERRALNTAFQKVLESVVPDAATRADPLLLDRNAEQALQARLATEVALVIKSYAPAPAEEAEALKLALGEINKLAVPTSPRSVKEPLELRDAALVFTEASGTLGAKPATDEKAIGSVGGTESDREPPAVRPRGGGPRVSPRDACGGQGTGPGRRRIPPRPSPRTAPHHPAARVPRVCPRRGTRGRGHYVIVPASDRLKGKQ